MKTMVSTAGGGTPAQLTGPGVLVAGAKAGPWVVERELGRGGMGVVYAVTHERIGKRAALKVVHGHLLVPGFHPDRVLLEARVVNQVGHPNIVDIFETGRLADGRPYLVMERLAGQPLAHRAEAARFSAERAIEILLEVCSALIAAHAAGVVHRDLKLDNVFLVNNPENPYAPKVKLLDWGIAKVIDDDVHHTVEGTLIGTPQYLAPEQARGAAVTPKSDVYSLGVMAFELFLDQLPFDAETSAEIMTMHLRAAPPRPRDLWADIPQPLEDLLLAMLSKQPSDRPTMREVARKLADIREDLALNVPIIVATETSARAIALRPTAEPAPRRPRWRYAAGALAIAASVALLVGNRADDVAAAAALEAKLPPVIVQPMPPPVPAVHAAAPAPDAQQTLIEPAPALTVTKLSTPRKTTQRARPSRSTSQRHAPVSLRRVKLDPDGTIDPYR